MQEWQVEALGCMHRGGGGGDFNPPTRDWAAGDGTGPRRQEALGAVATLQPVRAKDGASSARGGEELRAPTMVFSFGPRPGPGEAGRLASRPGTPSRFLWSDPGCASSSRVTPAQVRPSRASDRLTSSSLRVKLRCNPPKSSACRERLDGALVNEKRVGQRGYVSFRFASHTGHRASAEA